MRDGMGIMGAQTDVLQRAEKAISEMGAAECGSECSRELLYGNLEEVVAKISIRAQLGGKVRKAHRRPDLVVEAGGSKCWLEVIALDGELALLEDNDRSIMRQDDIFEHRRAITREIVAHVSRRVGRLTGWNGQVAVVIWDPLRTIARHGDLKGTLKELGERFPRLSALVLAKDDRLEVHDVPGSANALDGRVREGILRTSYRGLLAQT